MPLANSPPLNEVARFIVSLPQDIDRCLDALFVPIAFDQRCNGASSAVIVRQDYHFFMDSDSILRALCYDRAQRCVDEQLLVAGRPIRPENYLGLWRKAIADAKPISQLTAVHGIRLIAVLEGPRDALRGAKYFRQPVPYSTFEDFEARHVAAMQSLENGGFRLELDLAESNAARDALIGKSFLSCLKDKGQYQVQLKLRGGASGQSQQSPLFAAMEVPYVNGN